MHASLRHYRIEPKSMDELLRRVPGAVDVISKLPGFKAYYVIKASDDTLVRQRRRGALKSNSGEVGEGERC